MSVITRLVDDLDGKELPEGTTSTTFALNGKAYTIDLGEENLAAFEKVLATYIEHAQVVTNPSRTAQYRSSGRPAGSRSASGSGYNAETLAAIRAWGKQNGWDVAERGRVKAEIIEAWESAMK